MRELVYYIAASVDGFIADPSGDFSSFPQNPATLRELFARYPETCPAHVRDALGVSAQPRRFDTVLMGRRTHAPAVAAGLPRGAYPHLRQIVVTSQKRDEGPGIEVIGGDVAAQVGALKRESGRDIWLCGGAELASQLIDHIDEVQLKVNPILLGDGIPLFKRDARGRNFQAFGCEPLAGGVTLATFRAGTRDVE